MVNHTCVYVCVLSGILRKWEFGLLLYIYEEGGRKLYEALGEMVKCTPVVIRHNLFHIPAFLCTADT